MISVPGVFTFSYRQDGDSKMFKSSAKVAEALESTRIGEVNEWQGVCKHCFSAHCTGISTAVIFLLHTQFDKDNVPRRAVGE